MLKLNVLIVLFYVSAISGCAHYPADPRIVGVRKQDGIIKVELKRGGALTDVELERVRCEAKEICKIWKYKDIRPLGAKVTKYHDIYFSGWAWSMTGTVTPFVDKMNYLCTD
ncbi:hypothetical protein C0030_006070 [Candidatus Liberibacter solanacearum]|uniref:Lipoprotein n=1 Tax=Candidatus Liberibacter solanacearum TaxID=556287 RepID=A0A424FKU0_9HYPH|nr:hypothetical protein C0030_006070 [Candidatus Liberibacter solanacearum]